MKVGSVCGRKTEESRTVCGAVGTLGVGEMAGELESVFVDTTE